MIYLVDKARDILHFITGAAGQAAGAEANNINASANSSNLSTRTSTNTISTSSVSPGPLDVAPSLKESGPVSSIPGPVMVLQEKLARELVKPTMVAVNPSKGPSVPISTHLDPALGNPVKSSIAQAPPQHFLAVVIPTPAEDGSTQKRLLKGNSGLSQTGLFAVDPEGNLPRDAVQAAFRSAGATLGYGRQQWLDDLPFDWGEIEASSPDGVNILYAVTTPLQCIRGATLSYPEAIYALSEQAPKWMSPLRYFHVSATNDESPSPAWEKHEAEPTTLSQYLAAETTKAYAEVAQTLRRLHVISDFTTHDSPRVYAALKLDAVTSFVGTLVREKRIDRHSETLFCSLLQRDEQYAIFFGDIPPERLRLGWGPSIRFPQSECLYATAPRTDGQPAPRMDIGKDPKFSRSVREPTETAPEANTRERLSTAIRTETHEWCRGQLIQSADPSCSQCAAPLSNLLEAQGLAVPTGAVRGELDHVVTVEQLRQKHLDGVADPSQLLQPPPYHH
jgi:hypothetical protein